MNLWVREDTYIKICNKIVIEIAVRMIKNVVSDRQYTALACC